MDGLGMMLTILRVANGALLFFWFFALFYSFYRIPKLKKELREKLKNPEKKNENEKEEKYLLTYADLITLLMVNFMIPLAIQEYDPNSYSAYLSSIATGLMFACFIVFGVGSYQLSKIEKKNEGNEKK